MAFIKYLAVVLLISSTATAFAHPGGLNASGCHNNRKTGDYHCHRSGSSDNKPATTSAKKTDGAHSSSGNHIYRNCSEARAAGVTPIRIGQPGYASHLDRDNDGIACE